MFIEFLCRKGHLQQMTPRLQHKENKNDKDEIMREMHPTRPPRMESKVKEAMMQPVRKKKKNK